MSTTAVLSLNKRKGADALILPFFMRKPAFAAKEFSAVFNSALKAGDFKGKREETLILYPQRKKEKRLVLVGLGGEKQLNKEGVRRAYAEALRAIKTKAQSVNVLLPETSHLKPEDLSTAVIEGVLLTNYVFDANKTEKDKAVEKLTFIGADPEVLSRVQTICQGVYFTRNMVISNADDVTPSFLAKMAEQLKKEHSSITTKILRRAEIQKQKLGLLEAVGRASQDEPALILMEYHGAPHSKEKTAIIGKGITFDTGGLNLKPTGGIETMRDDMAGAGAILGTMHAIAALKLPINVIGAIGSTENAIGSQSYKPGDVYRSFSGVTVEVTNTDAEGRLVLADVISYVEKMYAPSRMVDLATLTGGAIIALGEDVSALMCNDDRLAEKLFEAGESTYERLWRLPLYEEYEQLLKSKVADIKNSGVRKASSIQGAMFIKKFVGKTSWAHIDIAGTAFPESLKPYHPIQATGVGVRLLMEFLQRGLK